jgi:prephenate dehydratase
MKVVTLGPKGTFSHELARKVFGDEIVLVPTIGDIFSEVEKHAISGLIPLENSEAGGVGPSLDGLVRHNVFITGELFMPVHHYLVSAGPENGIKVLYAHPQTHEQCSRVIEALGAEVIHTSSNAASAREMLKNPGSGAIVSKYLADFHGLSILKAHVEDNPDNTTRFVVISMERGMSDDAQKCSIIIDPHADRPGLLYDILGVFAEKKINLSRIESRPSRRGIGSYVFFIDFVRTSSCREAMDELQTVTSVKNLGCYRKIEVPAWK